MASTSEPRIYVFKADGAIAKGRAVKIGSDREHVVVCSANSDKAIGIAQSASSAAEEKIEIALPGGGAKALAGESITAGKYLVPASDGDLEQANAEGDPVIAIAMEDAAAGDLFAVEVCIATAHAADQ